MQKDQILTFETPTDLSENSILSALAEYRNKFIVSPTTLLVSTEWLDHAYRMLPRVGLTNMLVMAVPGFPKDTWILCGREGCFYSMGA